MKVRNLTSIITFLFVVTISFCTRLYAAQVTFIVDIETDTPPGEFITFNGSGVIYPDWTTVYPMTKIGENTWMLKLDIFQPGDEVDYRYGRNGSAEGGADEEIDGNNPGAYRRFTVTHQDMVIRDTVSKWRWWPADGKVPEIDTSKYRVTAPTGLNPDFMRGVQLPDLWRPNWLLPLGDTLDRIRDTVNSNWVQYTPIVAIEQHNPTPILDKNTGNPTSEADLVRILQAAEIRGLNMFLRPLVFPQYDSSSLTADSVHTDGYLSISDSSIRDETWWGIYFDQITPIYLGYARLAERYGVEVLGFSPWFESYQLTDNDFSIIDSLSSELLQKIREIYQGEIAVDFSNSRFPLQVFDDADYFTYKFWAIGDRLNKDSTYEELLTEFRELLDANAAASLSRWNKPIILNEISASSFKGAFTNDPDWEDHAIYYPDDPDTPLDLQGQADAYEAMLQAISERKWIAGAFSFSYWYWNSQDKTPSIRGKPAESVVAKWYDWFRGNLESAESPLLAPSLVTSLMDGDTLHISWLAAPGASGYILHYGFSAGNYVDQVNLGNVTRLSVPGVPPDTYYFTLSAYDAQNNMSDLTAEISFGAGVDHVQAPGNFYAEAEGNSVRFSWNPSTNGIRFILYYGTSPREYDGELMLSTLLSGTGWTYPKKIFSSFSVTDVPAGTYYVAIKALNKNGLKSDFSNEAKVIID